MSALPPEPVRRLRFLAALALVAAGCGRRIPASEGAAALWINLHRAGSVDLLVDADRLADGERAARRLAGQRPLAVECRALPAEAAPGAARIVAGTAESPAVRALAERLGITFEGERIALGPLDYLARTTVLEATFEDPARSGLPVTLLLAGDARRLGRAIDRLALSAHPRMRVWRQDELAFEARLSRSGRPHADHQRDLNAERRDQPGELVPFGERLGGMRIRAGMPVDLERLRGYVRALESMRGRLATWAPVATLTGRRVSVVPYARGDHGDELAWTVDGELVAWLGAGLPRLGDGGALLARHLLRDALGAPRLDWLLDAAAVDAADAWWGHALEAWCGRLATLTARPTFAELVEDVEPGASSHLVRPLRALAFRVLAARVDVNALWAGELDAAALASHAAAYDERLEQLARQHRASVESSRSAHRTRALGRLPLRAAGIDAPPRRGQASAFGTEASGASLDALFAAGANALIVHAHIARDQDGRPRSLEGDAHLAAVLGAARERDAAVVLVPHLLASPTGIAAGARVMTGQAQWQAFFADYAVALAHAALLAQAQEVDILCVGFGMPEAARTIWTLDEEEHPAQAALRPLKRDAWLGSIEATRVAFDGALTYCPGGIDKLRWVDFWDELDLMSFVYLPRLDTETRPWRVSDPTVVQRMTRGPTRALEHAAEQGKPLLLIETGFRSTRRAWRGGERRRNGGPYDGGEQARLLRCLRRALDDAQQAVPEATLAGWALWRWSNDPAGSSASRRGYEVQEKPAVKALGELFAR
ncbi:MAG: hypothetical protein GY711_21305 [bacterium]|nr:hypothetical protein [bacterium]